MFDFLRKNVDVPFQKDAAHRFVPMIVGMMVFLATLALVGASIISSIAKEWDAGYAPGYIVEIPITSSETRAEIDALEKTLFQVIRSIPGVQKASLISSNFSVINENKTIAKTPSSYLVYDLTIRNGHSLQITDITKRIAELRNNFSIVDHQTLRAEKLKISNLSIMISVAIAVMIGLAAVATISFVTHTGLEVHKSIIDILHTLGARRQYIAVQFQDQALILAVKGGIIGLMVSACALGGLGFMLDFVDIDFIKVGIEKSNIWLVVLLTPVLGLILATLAARITVMSALSARTKNC